LKDRKEEDQVKMNAEAWDIWLPKYIDRLTKEVEGKIDEEINHHVVIASPIYFCLFTNCNLIVVKITR
jgi:hypothetical protein